MRRALPLATPLALLLGVVLLPGGYRSAAAAAATPCSVAPESRSTPIVFQVEAGEERVAPGSRDQTARIVCRRLRAVGVVEAQIRSLPGRRMDVTLPRESISMALGALERAIVPGRFHFYDWEPNLIGREAKIGGHPGFAPPTGALGEAESEWRAAGRSPGRRENAQLIYAGAFPTAYRAIALASRQPSHRCSSCSASTPRLYMFDARTHRLIAGPAATRARLDAEAAVGGHPASGLVLTVPVGMAVVSEHPSDRSGRFDLTAAPGWFALRDRPALKGSEIADPEQSYGPMNEPLVSFGFTHRGRAAFERVTRAIAKRGRASAVGPVTLEAAAELSGHLAMVVDGEVKSRPIINFAENPDGIDGRNGAQISGFDNIHQAQVLVRVLGSGSLPLDLSLLPVRKPPR